MTVPSEWSTAQAVALHKRVRALTTAVLRGRADEAEKEDIAIVVVLELLARPPSEFAGCFIANLVRWRFADMCRERDPEAARRSRDPEGPFWQSGVIGPVVNNDGEEVAAGSPGNLLALELVELQRIAQTEIESLEAAALARCRDDAARGTLRRDLEELARLVGGEVTVESLVAAVAPERRNSHADTLYKRHERARRALVKALADVPDRTLSAYLGMTTHDLLLAHIERLRRQKRRLPPSGGSDG